jgi:hypothetical protein
MLASEMELFDQFHPESWYILGCPVDINACQDLKRLVRIKPML